MNARAAITNIASASGAAKTTSPNLVDARGAVLPTCGGIDSWSGAFEGAGRDRPGDGCAPAPAGEAATSPSDGASETARLTLGGGGVVPRSLWVDGP